MSLDNFMEQFSSKEAVENTPIPTLEGSLDSFIGQFAGISESFFFYGGEVEIKFDSVEHQYFLVDPNLGNLIPLLNVSSVSKIVDKSDALVPWAAKMAIEKLLRIIPTFNAELDPSKPPILALKYLTLEEFTKLALEAKGAHKDKLEDAGAVGKMAHEWIEKYIIALMVGEQMQVEFLLATMCTDERATNAAKAALLWMNAHNVRWKETERKVYSREHQCSGTMDGLCVVDSCDDPICCPKPFKDRLTIADWKTSNYLYLEYVFQTAAYEGFYEEEFGVDVEDRWVLRLGKDDGEFEAWHLPAEDFADDFAGFLACLHLLRIVDSIDVRIKGRKQLVKAAKKAARAVQKAAEKAAEKVRKAEEKAAAKLVREAEKARIKAEAKAERERIKAQVKAEKANFGTSPVSDKALQEIEAVVQVIEEPSLPSAEAPIQLASTHEGGAEVAIGLAPSQAAAPALSVEYDDEPVFKPIAIPEE